MWFRWILVTVCVIHTAHCATVDVLRQLYIDVIESNNPWIRPTLNESQTTNITVMFFAISAISLDDATQTMSTSGFLGIKWFDEFLVWSASNYSGASNLFPDPGKIWRPTLAVKNSIEKATPFQADFMYTTLSANGEVLWYPGDVFQTVCDMDVSNFPYDTHTCSIDLTLWRSNRNDVDLLMLSNMRFNMAEFVENNEWKLSDKTASRIKVGNSYYFIRLSFTLKRRPAMFLVNIVAPIFAIALLNVFVFLVPNQSGEKVQFGTMVLLAYAIFLSYTAGTLPQGWNTSSYLGNYFLVLQVFCIIYILLSILSTNMYTRDDYNHGVSKSLAKLVVFLEMVLLCRCCYKNKRKSSMIQVSPTETTSTTAGSEVELGTKKNVRISERHDVTWKRVSRVFDMLFFWIFLVIVIFSMIGVMMTITPYVHFNDILSLDD